MMALVKMELEIIPVCVHLAFMVITVKMILTFVPLNLLVKMVAVVWMDLVLHTLAIVLLVILVLTVVSICLYAIVIHVSVVVIVLKEKDLITVVHASLAILVKIVVLQFALMATV
jgi:hypothetical protein